MYRHAIPKRALPNFCQCAVGAMRNSGLRVFLAEFSWHRFFIFSRGLLFPLDEFSGIHHQRPMIISTFILMQMLMF